MHTGLIIAGIVIIAAVLIFVILKYDLNRRLW
jgi:hypothetical protein